jgi:type II secretory pathway predicted ATPase ExeA
MKNPFETKQYLAHYGLKEAPYSTNPDERLLYLADQHQDAIAMVGHVVENKEGAGLIVGEQGTGKTTIMRRMATLMNDAEGFRVAVVETAEHSPLSSN